MGRHDDRSHEPRSIAGRLPPHDLDAEAAVLSAILLDREALERVLDLLRPEHFYSDPNGRIYAAISQLAAAAVPVDIVTVAGVLRDQERLAQVGGPAYIGQLADATPAVAHVEAHARTVHDKWRLRRTIATCQRIAAEGYGDTGPAQEFIDNAQQALDELAQGQERSTSVTLEDALSRGVADLEPKPAGITGLPYGLVALDAATAGMHARNVILVGGPTGRGKTSFASCVAMHVASTPRIVGDRRESVGVLWIGIDNMPEDELAQRMAAARARVDLIKLKTGRGKPEDWALLTQAQEDIRGLPILFECHRRLTAMQVRAKLRSARDRLARAGTPLGFAVVDYFQKLKPDALARHAREETRESELRRASDVLQDTAAMLEIPLMVLIQEHDDAVKDCRAAGENAQVRLSISWKDVAKRAGPPPGCAARVEGKPAVIKVAKGRGAKLGPCDTFFFPEYTLFTDEAP